MTIDEIKSIPGFNVGPWLEIFLCKMCESRLAEKYKWCNSGPCPNCGARNDYSGSPPQYVEIWRTVSVRVRLRKKWEFWKGQEWIIYSADEQAKTMNVTNAYEEYIEFMS